MTQKKSSGKKLADLAKRYDKPTLYNSYCRLVEFPQEYEEITRKKMLDEVLAEFSTGFFLYNLCTVDELDFLKKLLSGNYKNKKKLYQEFHCEVRELVKKLIIDPDNYQVFEELIPAIKENLAQAKRVSKSQQSEAIVFLIGLLRAYVELPEDALIASAGDFLGLSPREVKSLLLSPLFRFYITNYTSYEMAAGPAKVLVYADYYNDELLHEDIAEARRKYTINAGSRRVCLDDYPEMFYYGMPLRTVALRRFYNAAMNFKPPFNNMLLGAFDKARLLYDKDILKDVLNLFRLIVSPDEYKQLRQVTLKAWEDMPSPALCGVSPKEYRKVAKEYETLSSHFTTEKQENAHLSEEDADYYYELYFALLEYVNKTRKISTRLKKIYRQKFLDPRDIQMIEDYLWSHTDECIDSFVRENPFDFSEDSLEVVSGFRSAITSDYLVIVGFEKDYTRVYDLERHCIYMIKGVRDNFDNLTPPVYVATPIGTTLLNFKGNIIYKGIFASASMDLGNSWKKQLLQEMQGAEECYAL